VAIRRIMVQCQPRQNSSHDPILKNPSQNRAGGVAQYEGPEFKPPTGKKKIETIFVFSPILNHIFSLVFVE
jgi:hypothetical protein